MISVVGIGGTLREGSSSEVALSVSLQGAADAGADIRQFTAHDLNLPFYASPPHPRSKRSRALVAALREADGVIISSPGYHGGISGLIKNALDYVEDLANDDRPYLSGLPVGCIGVAYGNQAAVAVLSSLRSTVHALRGFPTPYGAAAIAAPGVFTQEGCTDLRMSESLRLVGEQVAGFASLTQRHDATETA
jgi:FMN reductase